MWYIFRVKISLSKKTHPSLALYASSRLKDPSLGHRKKIFWCEECAVGAQAWSMLLIIDCSAPMHKETNSFESVGFGMRSRVSEGL